MPVFELKGDNIMKTIAKRICMLFMAFYLSVSTVVCDYQQAQAAEWAYTLWSLSDGNASRYVGNNLDCC